MDTPNTIQRTTRFAALALLVATLPACQKARMSSVPKPQPQQVYQPGPPPGFIPPGTVIPTNPPTGVLIPPTQPPAQPPVSVVPPRATLPTETPPATPDEPIVTPLPNPPTVPTSPNPPTAPPVVVTPPTQPATPPTVNEPTPVYTPPTYPPYVPVTTAPITPVYTPPSVPVTPVSPVTVQPSLPTSNPAQAIQIGRPETLIAVQQPTNPVGIVAIPMGNVVTPEPSGVVAQTPMIQQTPQGSHIFSTCRGSECYPKGQTYAPPGAPLPSLQCPEVPLSPTPITNKVDVLFVVDTSASMKEERVSLARQMAKYIEQLPADADYRIAMMLGHGPRSQHAQVGELFSTPTVESNGSLYGVIQVQDLMIAKRAQNDASIRAANGRSGGLSGQALEDLVRTEGSKLASDRLVEMMMKVPNDASETQGEAGLLNLYTAVTDSRRMQEMQRRGFWRNDAAKHVIFVADENDVCFDYQRAGLTGRYATEGDRRNETDAFNRMDVCAGTANGARLTPGSVFQAAKNSSRMPVSFSGYLYLDNRSIPAKSDRFAGDNEAGHGYLDVIALGFGQAVDLAQSSPAGAQAKMGHFSNFKMKADHVFEMQGVQDVTEIDPYSVRVLITDPSGKTQTFNATNVKLNIDSAQNKARVIIAYDTLAKVYGGGEIQQGSKIAVRYDVKKGAAAKALQEQEQQRRQVEQRKQTSQSVTSVKATAAKPQTSTKSTAAAIPQATTKSTAAAKPQPTTKPPAAAKPQATTKSTAAAKPQATTKSTAAAKPQTSTKSTAAAKPTSTKPASTSVTQVTTKSTNTKSTDEKAAKVDDKKKTVATKSEKEETKLKPGEFQF